MMRSISLTTVHETQFRIVELEERFQQQTHELATSLVSLIDLRDRYTGGHSARVANYVRGIAVQMALPDDETDRIVFAASLHDIGKIGVPDHILLKPGKLDEEEFEWIKKHPEWGWTTLRSVHGFQEAALLVLHHHERVDGRGYPSGLRGSEIPLGSRLITVADAYDAITTKRPYREPQCPADALVELTRSSGKQFDTQVLNAFCAFLQRSGGIAKSSSKNA